MDDTYKIVRKYFNGEDKLISEGLTLEEAKEHCSDDESSSKTCSAQTAQENPGVWFDVYYKE